MMFKKKTKKSPKVKIIIIYLLIIGKKEKIVEKTLKVEVNFNNCVKNYKKMNKKFSK